MPSLPNIPNNPPQGIQALLDKVYLWNPDVSNELISKVNELLAKLGDYAGAIKPYAELSAPIAKYVPCYYGDGVYVANKELSTIPAELNEADWELIANKGGGGDVASVNGKTGDVVLTAEDINVTFAEEETPLQTAIDTLKEDQGQLGDQIQGIEEKIPYNTSAKNPLVNQQQLQAVSLPDPTDYTGYFLTTDGVNANWAGAMPRNMKFANENNTNLNSYFCATFDSTATVTDDNAMNFRSSIVFGDKLVTNNRLQQSVVLGFNNTVDTGSTATASNIFLFGAGAKAAGSNVVAIGRYAEAHAQSVAIGSLAKANVQGAVQLGGGTLSDENVVMQVLSYPLLSKDGTIPSDRYTTTPTDAGTYVPKLTIAEDGTATREWGADSGGGGDYLPLSGGTLTGDLEIASQATGDFDALKITQKAYSEGFRYGWSIGMDSLNNFEFRYSNIYEEVNQPTFNTALTLSTTGYILPGTAKYIGSSSTKFNKIYVTAINNGADIAIPTTAGTIALAEAIAESVTTKDLTVSTDEGTLNIGITAGVATIATNNGLDIVSQTKFDTAPTTDDTTAWADVNSTALVTKQQVASALGEAGSTVTIRNWA